MVVLKSSREIDNYSQIYSAFHFQAFEMVSEGGTGSFLAPYYQSKDATYLSAPQICRQALYYFFASSDIRVERLRRVSPFAQSFLKQSHSLRIVVRCFINMNDLADST